jgi:hypothetical protein
MFVGHGTGPQLNVTRMILGETGTYNDVFHRPYKTSLGDEEYAIMREKTHGFQDIESETLANCAGSFLNPSAQPGSQVNIDHGWGEQRLRFMMSIMFEGRLSKTEQIVTGYTDRADLSYTGEMDPNTQFFINNVITLRHVENRTANGIGTSATVSDNFQVLRGTDPAQVTLRPSDVVRTQHSSLVMEGLNELGGNRSNRNVFDNDDESDVVYHDARNTFNPSETTRLSRRKNNLNANYMSSILKAYRTAQSVEDEYLTEDTIFEKTQGILTEPYSFDNPLLKMLTDNTGFSQNTAFTLKEIRELCPHVDKVMVLSRASTTAQLIPNQRGQTEGWAGSDNTTMIANIMASTIPAIALDHLITKIWFTATNETMHNEVVVELNHSQQNPPATFTSGIDISRQIQAFVHRIKHYVMRDVTHNNMVGVSVSVRYEALGDTFITVSCNGESPVDYVIPTFCDSLFSPVMSSDSTDLYSLSGDFQTLMDYSHGYPTDQQIVTQPPQSHWGSGGGDRFAPQPAQPTHPTTPRTIFN